MLHAWWEVECIYDMVGKHERRMPNERLRCGWEDNIKVDLKEII